MHFALYKRTLSPTRNVLEDASYQTRPRINAGDASLLMRSINKTRLDSLGQGAKAPWPPQREFAAKTRDSVHRDAPGATTEGCALSLVFAANSLWGD